ncbi:MAG: hypothetical protein ACTSUX_10170 [Promethearchaeota archaeon]
MREKNGKYLKDLGLIKAIISQTNRIPNPVINAFVNKGVTSFL